MTPTPNARWLGFIRCTCTKAISSELGGLSRHGGIRLACNDDGAYDTSPGRQTPAHCRPLAPDDRFEAGFRAFPAGGLYPRHPAGDVRFCTCHPLAHPSPTTAPWRAPPRLAAPRTGNTT